MTERFRRARILAAAMLIATGVGVGTVRAVGPEDTAPPSEPKPDKPSGPKATDQDSVQALDGFRAAYDAIYRQQDYARGIVLLRALGRDDHPEVANLLGFASRKLGRYAEAKHWYEKALAADPRHARTWSYYGMWHVEHGNVLKAKDYLDKVRAICGTGCREYTELKGVIEGTLTY
jgi:tetratricopeptide (TPR) repeat protein